MNGGFWARFGALADPVERRWLIGRLRNQWTAVPPPVIPAYLAALPALEEPGEVKFKELPVSPSPKSGLTLSLPGEESFPISADRADALVLSPSNDSLKSAAFHAFTWLAADQDGAALACLWPAWLRHHLPSRPAGGGSSPWGVEITALRAIAILDAARHIGLPGPFRQNREALAEHARSLQESLARFTLSPFLRARVGHALARIGFDLVMPATTRFGLAVLKAESAALLCPSGISGRSSTAQHLELCQWLGDVWLAARRQGHPEREELEELAGRALGVLPHLFLGGGMPLIGETSWALHPDWLDGLGRDDRLETGWTGRLPVEERQALRALREEHRLHDLTRLGADGWLRIDFHHWSGLWHNTINGWVGPQQGGHQDFAAPELHFGSTPIFVDAGGGDFGAVNGAPLCTKATAHGGLQRADVDPLPIDRPQYSDAFRAAAARTPPLLRSEFDGVSLSFAKLIGMSGLHDAERRWIFDETGFAIEDRLNGTGNYPLQRRFVTPLAVQHAENGSLRLEGEGVAFRLTADRTLRVTTANRWPGYGRTQRVSVIEAAGEIVLPWRGSIRVTQL